MNTPVENRVLCIYHASCMDGLGAAAIIHRYFKGAVDFKAMRYGDELPIDEMRDKHVYLVDFTFEPEVILPHINELASLVVIDHHHDAMMPWMAYTGPDSPDNLTVVYDSTRSGASLVWWFLYPSSRQSVPIGIQYLEQYDLWTKELPFTDEVQAAIRLKYPPKAGIVAIEALSRDLPNFTQQDIDAFIATGKIARDPINTMAASMAKRGTFFIDIFGFKGVACCPAPAELVNEIGEYIYTTNPSTPFVIMFEDNYVTGERKYSFRSARTNGADVSYIAKMFGGKGHFNSAGARVKMELDARVGLPPSSHAERDE